VRNTQVIVDRQYSTQSVCDKGTLYQLKQVVNRTSFGKEPKHNMKATEDFMETVLCSHILAAAKECTDSSRMTCNEVAKWIVKTFVKMTVPKFEEPSSATRPDSGATEPASNLTNATINPTSGIQLATNPTSSVQPATNPTNSATNPTSGAQSTYEEVINDSVHLYAVDFLGMALFWHAFHDAIREGDGNRILRYWKYMAAIFRQEKH